MYITERLQSLQLSNDRSHYKTLLLDFIIIAGMYAAVCFAHIIPFSLYKLEPMKLFLLVAVLYSSRGNALLMAATIPIISTASSGHPIFPKNLIIGVELMAFAGILTSKTLQHQKVAVRFLSALMASKVLYYAIKALVIYSGWMSMTLFSSPVQFQILGALIVMGVYWILSSMKTDQV